MGQTVNKMLQDQSKGWLISAPSDGSLLGRILGGVRMMRAKGVFFPVHLMACVPQLPGDFAAQEILDCWPRNLTGKRREFIKDAEIIQEPVLILREGFQRGFGVFESFGKV